MYGKGNSKDISFPSWEEKSTWLPQKYNKVSHITYGEEKSDILEKVIFSSFPYLGSMQND